MAMVHKAMPHLGSVPTLTRLSLTCRSLLDPKFLSALATCWPALECLRLARPLKDDADMKAFVLYRYDFASIDGIIARLVGCLRNLKRLGYIAIDLAFADFRAMRNAHAINAPAPEIPKHLTLPKSLRPPSFSSLMAQEISTDADGDIIMVDSPASPSPQAGPSTNGLGLSGPALSSAPEALWPTSHNPDVPALACPFCRRSYRAHSYYLEHEVAMGLGQGLASLAAVRFRASFPDIEAGDSRENKWLIRRGNNGDPTARWEEEEDDVVEVWAPRWD